MYKLSLYQLRFTIHFILLSNAACGQVFLKSTSEVHLSALSKVPKACKKQDKYCWQRLSKAIHMFILKKIEKKHWLGDAGLLVQPYQLYMCKNV